MISKTFFEKLYKLFKIFSEVFDELEVSNEPSIQKAFPLFNIMEDELKPTTDLEIIHLEDVAIEALKAQFLKNIRSHYLLNLKSEDKIQGCYARAFSSRIFKQMSKMPSICVDRT